MLNTLVEQTMKQTTVSEGLGVLLFAGLESYWKALSIRCT